eukprot:scaffold462_cov195-Pinguiococcus_pyrenoidosus.AAC.61
MAKDVALLPQVDGLQRGVPDRVSRVVQDRVPVERGQHRDVRPSGRVQEVPHCGASCDAGRVPHVRLAFRKSWRPTPLMRRQSGRDQRLSQMLVVQPDQPQGSGGHRIRRAVMLFRLACQGRELCNVVHHGHQWQEHLRPVESKSIGEQRLREQGLGRPFPRIAIDEDPGEALHQRIVHQPRRKAMHFAPEVVHLLLVDVEKQAQRSIGQRTRVDGSMGGRVAEIRKVPGLALDDHVARLQHAVEAAIQTAASHGVIPRRGAPYLHDGLRRRQQAWQRQPDDDGGWPRSGVFTAGSALSGVLGRPSAACAHGTIEEREVLGRAAGANLQPGLREAVLRPGGISAVGDAPRGPVDQEEIHLLHAALALERLAKHCLGGIPVRELQPQHLVARLAAASEALQLGIQNGRERRRGCFGPLAKNDVHGKKDGLRLRHLGCVSYFQRVEGPLIRREHPEPAHTLQVVLNVRHISRESRVHRGQEGSDALVVIPQGDVASAEEEEAEAEVQGHVVAVADLPGLSSHAPEQPEALEASAPRHHDGQAEPAADQRHLQAHLVRFLTRARPQIKQDLQMLHDGIPGTHVARARIAKGETEAGTSHDGRAGRLDDVYAWPVPGPYPGSRGAAVRVDALRLERPPRRPIVTLRLLLPAEKDSLLARQVLVQAFELARDLARYPARRRHNVVPDDQGPGHGPQAEQIWSRLDQLVQSLRRRERGCHVGASASQVEQPESDGGGWRGHGGVDAITLQEPRRALGGVGADRTTAAVARAAVEDPLGILVPWPALLCGAMHAELPALDQRHQAPLEIEIMQTRVLRVPALPQHHVPQREAARKGIRVPALRGVRDRLPRNLREEELGHEPIASALIEQAEARDRAHLCHRRHLQRVQLAGQERRHVEEEHLADAQVGGASLRRRQSKQEGCRGQFVAAGEMLVDVMPRKALQVIIEGEPKQKARMGIRRHLRLVVDDPLPRDGRTRRGAVPGLVQVVLGLVKVRFVPCPLTLGMVRTMLPGCVGKPQRGGYSVVEPRPRGPVTRLGVDIENDADVSRGENALHADQRHFQPLDRGRDVLLILQLIDAEGAPPKDACQAPLHAVQQRGLLPLLEVQVRHLGGLLAFEGQGQRAPQMLADRVHPAVSPKPHPRGDLDADEPICVGALLRLALRQSLQGSTWSAIEEWSRARLDAEGRQHGLQGSSEMLAHVFGTLE